MEEYEKLDPAYHPCMNNLEIYMAGGYGWYAKQQAIIERNLARQELEESSDE